MPNLPVTRLHSKQWHCSCHVGHSGPGTEQVHPEGLDHGVGSSAQVFEPGKGGVGPGEAGGPKV